MSLKVDRVQLEIEIKNDSSRKRLRELEDQINGMRKSMKNMKDSSPEYAKQQKELHALVKEYDGIINKIGITNLSLTELRKRQKDLNSILRNMPPTNENYGAYKDEIAKVNARIKELRGNAKETGNSLSKFGTSFQVFAGNMMTKGVAKIGEWYNDAKEFVKEGIKMADKSEGVVTAFNKLNIPNLLKNIRSETKGLISDFQIMQTAVKAEKFGIPLSNLGSLLKFAQQRAQETGESIDYLVDSIINGIGRKSSLILDNLGISASRLQAETKKAGDFASAAINIVNEELKKQGDLALTSADKATQSAIKWENAQLKVGQRFQWLGGLWDKISGNIADNISSLAGDTRSLTHQYQDQIGKVADLEVNTAKLMPRYIELSKKTNLTKEEHKELDGILQQVAKTVPIAVTEWDKYGNAIAISTEKVNSFIQAERIRLKLMYEDKLKDRRNQLVGYVSEFEKLQKQMDALERGETLKKWQGSTTSVSAGVSSGSFVPLSDQEVVAIRKRYAVVKGLVLETNEEINFMNGSSAEKEAENQIKTEEARNRFNAMNKKQLTDWIKDEKNAKDQYLEIAKSIYNQRYGNSDNTTPKSDKSAAQRTKLNNELKKIEEDHLKEMAAIQKKYLSGGIETEFDFNQAILSQQDQFDAKRKDKLQELSKTLTDTSVRIDILKQIADIDKKMLDRQVDQANKIKKIILASDPIASEKEAHNNRLREVGLFGKKREDLSKEQLSALEQLEKQHAENMQKLSTKEAIIALKELDLNQSESIKHLEERRISEKMGEQQYRDELLKIEIDYLNKRLRINGLSSEKIAEINKQINKVTAEGISNKGQARETVINKFNIKSLKDQKEEELSVIKYYEDQKIITEDEALKIRKQINDQYLASSIESFSKANDAIQQVGGNLTGAMTNFQSAEEDAISRKYDKQIKAAEGNSKLQKKLEAKKEEEVNKIRAKYADKQFAVQTAQIISETSLAAMRAYSALAGIPVVGPALGAAAAAAAITYGASQIKVAKEQRDAAKEGYQSGGFTSSSSRDDKEAGVVHTNEFVANANAVRNPSVRKFLDVFDMAQKNGSIHMLNTTQILEKVRSETNRGYQSGGYTPSTDSSRNIEKTLISIIENNTNAMDRMVTQIDNGIEAYSVISGDNGSYRQTQKYESYIKRASRQSR